MALVGTGHHFHFHVFDGISRKTRLTWLRNAAALTCLAALIATMWVGGNLSALMHTPILDGVPPLAAVVLLACSCMSISLLGLVAAGFFQFRVEQLDTPTTT
ncbi:MULTISPECIES: hypothetical protein [Ralstonia solanacearum species complex]|uniref:Transmembrane protein n=2 Tax=Ralstonia solanacearum TaxID=305 RepID=A0AAW5ZP30_RALSL|nr:hypothetical protein [Ralstonia solanacearum]AST30790.2 hypothetical protein CDC46_00415 [Ralstonia solanacearum]ATJ87591.1 hypothetical protein CDC59_15710 [Ralstonia solanacearum]AYB52841.2 hypothetical protein C2I38_16050 [Ralstonia solanacearum]AYB57416.1 hypothetical protein C2L97_16050 [Ralstonia solanacearum]MBT1536771.1 hypothetical protein [Ralstonia solanacearum]